MPITNTQLRTKTTMTMTTTAATNPPATMPRITPVQASSIMAATMPEPRPAVERVRARRTSIIEVVHVIDIEASPSDVFAYVVDVSRAHEWRNGVVGTAMDPSGPIRSGSRLRNVTEVAGYRVITDSVVDAFEPARRFTFRHVSGPLPISGEIIVNSRLAETRPGAATLRCTLRIRPAGGRRLIAPLLGFGARRTVREALHAMATRIEAGER